LEKTVCCYQTTELDIDTLGISNHHAKLVLLKSRKNNELYWVQVVEKFYRVDFKSRFPWFAHGNRGIWKQQPVSEVPW